MLFLLIVCDTVVLHIAIFSGSQTDSLVEQEEEMPLEDSILQIIGYDIAEKKADGTVHKVLANIWSLILQDGLAKDQLAELISKYPAFSNCPLMEPPKINAEVKASIGESSLTRDLRLVSIQNRICAGLSALGSALGLLFAKERQEAYKPVIELISDAAKLFADVHHEQSQARRGLLKGVLNKEMADTLTESSRDGWLFGDNLTERIKAAKALDATSKDLKIPKKLPSSSKPGHTKRTLQPLNFKRPPRLQYPTRQGGHKTSHYYNQAQARGNPKNTYRSSSSNRRHLYPQK